MRPTLPLVLIALTISIASYCQNFKIEPVSDHPPNLTSVYMINSAIGYAGGDNGIYKTVNGGVSWALLPDFVSDGTFPHDYYTQYFNGIKLFFSDEMNGIAYGYHMFSGELVMTTTNGGESWEVRHFANPENIYSNNRLNDLTTYNASTFFIAGNNGRVLRSTDNGVSWTGIQVSGGGEDFSAIRQVSETTVIVGGGRELYVSLDGGNSWSQKRLSFFFNDFHFFNELEWVATEPFGDIYRTFDGGVTWKKEPMKMFYPFSQLMFIDDQIGFATNQQQEIFKTKDGGSTWLKIYTSQYPVADMHSISTSDIRFATTGHILHTVNGGEIDVKAPVLVFSDLLSGSIGDVAGLQVNNGESIKSIKLNGVPADFWVGFGFAYMTVPRGATSGKIELVWQGGSVFSSFDFNVSDVPYLYIPAGIKFLPGEIVLEGENLLETQELRLNSINWDYTVIDDQHLSFQLPFDFPGDPILSIITPSGHHSIQLPILYPPNYLETATLGAPGTWATINYATAEDILEITWGEIPVNYRVNRYGVVEWRLPEIAEVKGEFVKIKTLAGVAYCASATTIYPKPIITSISPTNPRGSTDPILRGA